MRGAASSLLVAFALVAGGAACAGFRTIDESDLREPRLLVGNTVRVPAADGRTEALTVTRVEGNTLVGYRPWDYGQSVRGPEEVRVELPKELLRAAEEARERARAAEKERAIAEQARAIAARARAAEQAREIEVQARAIADRERAQRAPRPAPPSPTAAALAARPRGVNRLAVLDFRGALGADSLEALSEEARGAAADSGRQHGVLVMTRESIAVVLKDMTGSSTCTEGECEVETARNIGADLVITGRVLKVEGTYLVNVKLHESAGGSLLGAKQVRGTSTLELLDGVRGAVGALLR